MILMPKKEIMDKMMEDRTREFAKCFPSYLPTFPDARGCLSLDEAQELGQGLALMTVFPIEMIRANGDLRGVSDCLGAMEQDNMYRWKKSGLVVDSERFSFVLDMIARLEI